MSTHISWTDETWNPVTGCSRVSEGCRNCYAAKLAPRLAGMGQKGYTKLPWTARNAAENVMIHEDRLEKPLRWKKPRRVFVNSMSDLFHERVSDDFIWRVFGVMAQAKQHTFQILTKRPERMASFTQDPDWHHKLVKGAVDARPGELVRFSDVTAWPLPNVGLGTSVEDDRVIVRVLHLLRVRASVRFLSCEPLLGPLVLDRIKASNGAMVDALQGDLMTPDGEIYAAAPGSIDWVIAGGESGLGFRPMDLDWARSLRDQCVAAGVPFFFKQGSGLRPEQNALLDGEEWRQFPVEEVKHG